MSDKPVFDQWCILELLGHTTLAGRVTEEERFGDVVGRIDIPQGDGSFITQFFGGRSIYRLSPVSEEVARAKVPHTTYMPISVWELPEQPRQLVAPAQESPCDD